MVAQPLARGILLTVFLISSCPAQQYEAIVLNALPGDAVTQVFDLNDATPPEIVGVSGFPGPWRAVKWRVPEAGASSAEAIPLAAVADFSSGTYYSGSEARGINDAGAIVGTAFHDASAGVVGVVWNPLPSVLPVDPGSSPVRYLTPAAIANNGVVVGSAAAGAGLSASFLYSPGSAGVLPRPEAGRWLNDAAANASDPPANTVAVGISLVRPNLVSEGGVIDLLGSGEGWGYATSVAVHHDAGDIAAIRAVGVKAGEDLVEHALLWSWEAADGSLQNGALSLLPELEPGASSRGHSVNHAGAVVGVSFLPAQPYRSVGFLWTEEGGTRRLDDLLVPDADWRIERPIAINDAGLMIARAHQDSPLEYQSVLLRPVSPQPPPCLAVTKAGPPFAYTGDVIEYEIRVTNYCADPVEITVDDLVSESADLMPATLAGWIGSGSQASLLVPVDALSSITLPLQAVVLGPPGADVINEVRASVGAESVSAPVVRTLILNRDPVVDVERGDWCAAVGSEVIWTVTASDADGSVVRVEFLDEDGGILAVDTAPPFDYTTTTGSPGRICVGARAVDDLGGTTDAAPRCVLFVPETPPIVSFEIADLLPPTGSGTSEASDINEAGIVVGGADYPSGGAAPCRWENGVGQYILPETSPFGSADGINGAGVIVGTGHTAWNSRAFRWNGSATSLPGVYGAIDINDSGTILARDVLWRPHFWRNGTMTPLSTPDAFYAHAYSLNRHDHTCVVENPLDGPRASYFVLADARRVLLPGEQTDALSLNDFDVIVGSAVFSGSQSAALWMGTDSPRDPVPIPDFGESGWRAGFDISESGWIVGTGGVLDEDHHNHQRAYLHVCGTTYDLNSMIPEDSGWVLAFAAAVNDAGQIVGVGSHDGQRRGFLLTPQY